MKKLLLAVVIGLVLVLALATTALADNGPHGGFSANDDACAGCHSIHRAQGTGGNGYLLKNGGDTVYEVCTACHALGAGADTDVVNGVYRNASSTEGDYNGCLFAGGFVRTACQHTYTGKAFFNDVLAAPNDPVASRHDVTGASNIGTIWGSGPISGTAFTGASMDLECTSCHDPHGNAGKALDGSKMPSYRLLRYNVGNGYEPTGTPTYFAVAATTGQLNAVAGAGTTGGVTVLDTAAKWYTHNSVLSADGLTVLDSGLASVSLNATTRGNRVVTYARNDPFGRSRGATYQRPGLTATERASTTQSCNFVTTPGTLVPTDNYNFTLATYTGSVAAANQCNAANAKYVVNGTAFSNYTQRVGITLFCSQCHDRYLASGNVDRNVDSGDALYKYRHSSGASAQAGSDWSCIDCHFAHGTSATATTALDTMSGAALPNGASGASLAGDSALLKIDNRGLCVRCHGGAVNFNYSTTVP